MGQRFETHCVVCNIVIKRRTTDLCEVCEAKKRKTVASSGVISNLDLKKPHFAKVYEDEIKRQNLERFERKQWQEWLEQTTRKRAEDTAMAAAQKQKEDDEQKAYEGALRQANEKNCKYDEII